MRVARRGAALAVGLACALPLAGAGAACDGGLWEWPRPREGKAVRLFNGRNLDGFETQLARHGRNSDPERVFTVEHGMIHVSGTDFGHLLTTAEYGNFHLSWEFKWGDSTHGPREGKARDSGVVFHSVDTVKIWGKATEFQMIEGGTGDCIMIDGATRLDHGQPTTRRQDRRGKGPWRDVIDYRDPEGEVEKPRGEWNHLDLIARDGNAWYRVNGKLVNTLEGLTPSRGHILFQTEGAELYFRRIELRPLLQ